MPPKGDPNSPGPVPKDALEFFQNKGLEPSFNYSDVWQEEHAASFTVAKVLELDILATVRGMVERAIEDGQTFETWRKDAKDLLDQSGWSEYNKEKSTKSRLRVIYDTNMRTARACGQWQRIERTKTVLPFLTYGLGPSLRHREEHEAWAGTTLPIDDPWWESHQPPSGYLCFHESSMVSGDIIGASKARYTGDMIEIQTALGARLAVTPNHPIATTRGLTPVGDLRKGDHCFCNRTELELVRGLGFPQPSARTVRDENIPSFVGDVFNSLRAHRSGTVEVSPLDFHNEAKFFDGKVDVVGSYVQLMDRIDSFLLELLGELPLAFRNSPLLLEFGFGGGYELGFCFAPPVGCSPGTRAVFGDLLRRHFGKPQNRRFGSASYSYPSVGHHSGDGLSRYAFGARNALDGFSCDVAIDEIVSIREFQFSGHVFDLETESGWLWANSIAAGNCKCWIRQIGTREVERLGGVTGRPPTHDVQWDLPDGRTVSAPVGVHPSFNYNFGKNRTAGLEDALTIAEGK